MSMSTSTSTNGTATTSPTAPDRSEAVARFAQAFLERYGATLRSEDVTVDEATGELARRLHAALPATLAEHFEREVLSLVFRPGVEPSGGESVLVTPGSRLFARMLGWLRDRGQLTWLPLRAAHPALDALPEVERPDHLPGEPEVESMVAIELELAVRVAFVAEERHEELALVHVPQHGAARVVERSAVARLVEAGLLESTDPALPVPEPARIEAQIAAGLEAARAWAHQIGKPREDRILERLSLEVQRLTHYFGELIAEHELEDEVREGLAAELDRRVSEEVAKHRLAIELEPVACALIARPQVTFTWTDADGDRWLYAWDRVDGEVRRPVVSPSDGGR